MKKVIFSGLIAIFSMFSSFSASAAPYCVAAGYCSSADVVIYHVDQTGIAYVGIDDGGVNIPGTCEWFTRQFRFDSKTSEGKSLLSILMSLVAQKKKVKIWFDEVDPSIEGTDQSSGCTNTGVATLTGIGWGI